MEYFEERTLSSLINKDNDIKSKPSNIEESESKKSEEEEGEEKEENSESDGNIDFPLNNNFLIKSKEKIFKNYVNNYVNKNYKFTNNEFSLSANNFEKKVFVKINGLIIFEINYLIKIKINNRRKEWVCNAYYGLYLLYRIKKCQKPCPIYPNNNNEIEDSNEIKTISNQNDFDNAMSKGVNEFEDKDYQINIEQIIDNIIYSNNIKALKVSHKKYLNLNEQVPERGDYKFLKHLFEKNNLFEEYIYIFGSKNYLNNEVILNELINIYNENTGRFLYLDLDYINNLKYRNDLKQYLAFWLIRAFFEENYKEYKNYFNNIVKSIDFSNIPYIIKSIIKYNEEKYKEQKLFIVLNNVNNEKAYNIIYDIKKLIDNSIFHHFIIFLRII